MSVESPIRPSVEFRALIETESGQKIVNCYQCGKCSAGCPTSYAMDLTPRQIMRATQLGMKKEILGSSTIWLCVSCQICSARCPAEIDIPKVIETLRIMAIREEASPAQPDIAVFHRTFINLVKTLGRVPELFLGAYYNLRSGHLLTNINFLPQMFSKGKLSLLPARVKNRTEIKSIFSKTKT